VPSTADPAAPLARSALDLRALARRSAAPVAALGAAAVATVAARAPLQAFVEALGRALDADPRWVAVAGVCELLSFGGYIALLRLVGGGATPRLGLRTSAHVEADLALASVLAYRAVAIWLPAPFGLAALGALQRTAARWVREDSPAPEMSAVRPARAPIRELRAARAWPCPELSVQVAA
jgi:hypothetical protein